MDKNRELQELLGLHWHEYMWKDDDTIPGGGLFECGCGHKTHFQWSFKINPDYASDPRLVLREIEKKGNLGRFILWIWCDSGMVVYNEKWTELGILGILVLVIKLIAIDTTGKLRDLAIRWLKE